MASPLSRPCVTEPFLYAVTKPDVRAGVRTGGHPTDLSLAIAISRR